MNFEKKQLEEELSKLAPAALPGPLLERLDGAMRDAATQAAAPAEEKIIVASSDSQLTALEDGLRDLVPYGVPADMIARLDEAMSRWHEEVPVEEKVVPMHAAPAAPRTRKLGLRSVAAVACLGAGFALMTNGGQPPQVADSQQIPDHTQGGRSKSAHAVRAQPIVFTSQNTGASLISASDHGVIWTKDGQPVRCTEVHLTKRVQFLNERGERLIIEQPKREVRFTPVKFD